MNNTFFLQIFFSKKTEAQYVFSFKNKVQFLVFAVLHLSFFVLFSCSAQSNPPADTSAYQLVDTIKVNARLIAADKLQQLYVVTKKNEVIKYDAEGNELFRYTNNTLGELTHIDATNPFSVLLYYPDYMMVYTLDRTLNKTGEFNLFDLDLTVVQTVALSNDNNVWLYDDVFYKIKKVNRNGDVLRESANLLNQLDISLTPNFILERENWLYVNDVKLGVLVFDIYGQYSRTITLKDLLRFQILGSQLIYQEGQELKSFHLQSLQTKIIDLPENVASEDQVIIKKNKLFVRKKDRVEIYKY
ncbi:MAG: hypothetical protein AAF573_14690 [Bacteroidota bacterium]